MPLIGPLRCPELWQDQPFTIKSVDGTLCKNLMEARADESMIPVRSMIRVGESLMLDNTAADLRQLIALEGDAT